MRRATGSLKLKYYEITGLGGLRVWRRLEQRWGVERLFTVARAYYLCRATLNELTKWPPKWRDEPAWLKISHSLPARIRRRMQRYLNTLAQSFPDRLTRPEWISLCRLEGVEHLQAARQAGRPVVLVFFHFGPILNLRQWVQAHGFRAAALVGGDAKSRGRLMLFQDSLSPFPEIPQVFYPHQLKALTKFVKDGNMLFIAVDLRDGRQTSATIEGWWTAKINSGAARLANNTGADLILCSTINEDFWRFRIKFHPPIPGETLRTEADVEEANRRLLEMMVPEFKAYPEQVVLPILWQRPEIILPTGPF